MEREPDVSKNYASALLAAAKKHNVPLDDALSEALALRELVLARPRFKLFLEGPQFRAEDKGNMIRNAFQGNSSDLFMYFMLLLLRRGRLVNLIDILDEFEQLVDQEGGVTEGSVTTAVELSDEEKNQCGKNWTPIVKSILFCNSRSIPVLSGAYGCNLATN